MQFAGQTASQRALIPLLAMAVLLNGCALWPQKKEKPKTADQPRYVGRIATVNSAAHFAIVDMSGFQSPATGTDLQAMDDGQETAVLRVGSEARRPFVVADILSGDPQEGDTVWLKKNVPES